MGEGVLAVFPFLDADDGGSFQVGELGQGAVAVVVRLFFLGTEQYVALEFPFVPMAGGLGRDGEDRRHHARARAAEFSLQVFADGGGNAVFFQLGVAVVDDVDHVAVQFRELKVQEETVEPGGVIPRQVEAGLAALEKVLVVLEGVAVGRKFLPLGGFHHFPDGLFGVHCRRVGGGVLGRLLFEDVGELRVAQGVFAHLDATVRIDHGDNAEDDEQADDGKKDFEGGHHGLVDRI